MMRDSGMWSMQSPSKRKCKATPHLFNFFSSAWFLQLSFFRLAGKDEAEAEANMTDSSTISSATGLSSASSNNGLQLQTILNSSDDSPHRFSSASATSAGTPPSARHSNHQVFPEDPFDNRSLIAVF